MDSCILCDSTVKSFIYDGLRDHKENSVIKCDNCGLVQLSIIPKVEEDKDFYDKNTQAKWVERIDLVEIEKKLADDTLRRCEYISSILSNDSKVADIGTGYGFFVKEVSQRNINVCGYEVGEQRRKIAEEIIGSKVYDNNLLDTDDNLVENYDCITLFQVLEHISDPRTFVLKLYNKLNTGGKLIIEVPNYDDWMIQESKDYEAFYYQRAHLSYYNKQSLTELFSRLGIESYNFEYIQRYSIANAYHWILNGKPQISNPNHYETGIRSEVDEIYKKMLISKGITDTIIAVVEKI
jgi:2-polyprenyl-3-methyl-5-hydroxy-6-metoxy-1,4-benzoquinol methylase